jgi:glucose/arabinose dehydrogenase
MKRLLIFIFLAIAVVTFFFGSRIKNVVDHYGGTATTTPVFVEHPIYLSDGTTFSFTAPENYSITPTAQGMKRIRFMAWSPDSRLFVTDMYDLSDNTKGKVYILDNFNKETGQFASSTVYASNLRNPNSVAFYRDSDGQQWIYIAVTHALIRYKYENGDTQPSGAPLKSLHAFLRMV